jgi:DNA polymerase-3 subunit epsilon/CBS domain-containing protein
LEAAATVVERHIGALLVGDADRPPDGSSRARLAAASGMPSVDFDRTTIGDVMSAPVESMGRGELLYRALARMDRMGIRHLCVVDDHGIAVGMVSQRDLLEHRARGTSVVDDALATADSIQSLAAGYGRVPQVAAGLSADGLGGAEVARMVSAELRALSARSVALALQRLHNEGHGDPPAPWCFFLLGSGGAAKPVARIRTTA